MRPEGVLRTPMGIHVLKDDWCLSRWCEDTGRLDRGREEIHTFAQHIPEGGVVINAGASLGDHACVYAQIVGPQGRVYAYEPVPLAYEALARNMAHFTNVTTFPYALGPHLRSVKIWEAPDRGSSSIMPHDADGVQARMRPEFGGGVLPMVPHDVDMVTLDAQLLPRLTRCDLIHLDVEGLEPQVLYGAQELLTRFRPTLILECWSGHLARWNMTTGQFDHMLDWLGYDATSLGPVDGSSAGTNVLALARPVPAVL